MPIGRIGIFCFYFSVTHCDEEEIELIATPQRQIIMSPNFPHGYPPSQQCFWRIYAPHSYEVVHIRAIESHIEPDNKCEEDFVEVLDGKFNTFIQVLIDPENILIVEEPGSVLGFGF